MVENNGGPQQKNCVMDTYARVDVSFVRGQGITLFDDAGNEYLDFLGGLAVSSLGHSHPAMIEAITEQAGRLLHTSNLYRIPNQEKLAAYIASISFGARVFFCNSGAEANEGSVKLARRYHAKISKTGKSTLLTFHGSFHGRTLAMLAATGQAKYRDGFDPMPAGFVQVPFNDIEAVKKKLDEDQSIGAVMTELIQAEGGVVPGKERFITELRAITEERGLLLICDEVQTGMGRTGKTFAYEHYGIVPDIMSLAKGLAGGVPIGAVVAREEIAAAFAPGSHATTFGGNPLSTAAAIAVIKVFLNDQLVERSAARGEYILGRLKQEQRSPIKEIRGKGLLIGIELECPAAPIVVEMRRQGYLLGTAGENVVRITPPLIVSQGHCAKMIDVLERTLHKFQDENP